MVVKITDPQPVPQPLVTSRKLLLISIYLIGFVIRVGLQLTKAPDALYSRIEVSTPVTSYKKLLEGRYLYTHGIDPYDGGTFHQSPLLLALLTTILELPYGQTWIVLIYSSLDLIVASLIIRIKESSYARKLIESECEYPSWILAACALLNPFAILISTSRSSATFTTLAILLGLYGAVQGKVGIAGFGISLATYQSFYPILLLFPITLVIQDVKQIGLLASIFGVLTTFLLSFASMTYSSILFLGTNQYLYSMHSILLLMTDLAPNIGLWWYFFTEMFEDFRNFFLGVFQLHLLIYVVPLCIKLRKDPLFVVITLCGLLAIFKPYPSIADTNLYMILLPLYPQLIEHMRYLFLVSCALLYCCTLGPAFYYLWIYAGSGNANFYYAITLVWNLSQGILLSDTVYAFLKVEWENEKPAERKGKMLELAQVPD